ncbi:hypothetical protein FOL47_003845 [Perkinsus chesapeaki]|uniref:P-type phospholipid transporter n=1 Tax=Perkinsus chesapeaki TaxID=330153 RepID=A0A7J6M759_PERCH|nr:hypothetical protein FOL47_003845 [Perkinsus chesapeaki]
MPSYPLFLLVTSVLACAIELTVNDLSSDPWIVTPMLAGGEYGLPDTAVQVEDKPGDLELTLRKLEREVEPEAHQGEGGAGLRPEEYAALEPDQCGRAFEHLFKQKPAWQDTKERVNSVINEIMAAIDKGEGNLATCYSLLGLLVSTSDSIIISDEQMQRILLFVEDMDNDRHELRKLPAAIRLYKEGAERGCTLGALAYISSLRLGYHNLTTSDISLSAKVPPSAAAALQGQDSVITEGECMTMARMDSITNPTGMTGGLVPSAEGVSPIVEAVVGNIGWDRLRVRNDADARSIHLKPGQFAPDDDVSMFYSWMELLPHSQWRNLESYLSQEQIDELVAYLSDEESVASGIDATEKADLGKLKDGPAEVHASLQELRYNIVAGELNPALDLAATGKGDMRCGEALDTMIKTIGRYHRTLRILDGISHTHPSDDIKLLAAQFCSEMGLKSGHVNSAELIKRMEQDEIALPSSQVLSCLPNRGLSCPRKNDDDNAYLYNDKMTGGEPQCVQGCRTNEKCQYAIYFPSSGQCKWCTDCPVQLRTKQHDTRLWVKPNFQQQDRRVSSLNYRTRAALEARDAYSVNVLIENYRGSGVEGDRLAYTWASYGADVLGDYQCMFERAMMDAVNWKNYDTAVHRLLDLSAKPPVVFLWEIHPLDQFSDPELEMKVMHMVVENNPFAAVLEQDSWDTLGGNPTEEELREMQRAGAMLAPPPHVTASMAGIVVVFLAYAFDSVRFRDDVNEEKVEEGEANKDGQSPGGLGEIGTKLTEQRKRDSIAGVRITENSPMLKIGKTYVWSHPVKIELCCDGTKISPERSCAGRDPSAVTTVEAIPWQYLTAGSVICLGRGEDVPADFVLLASSDPHGLIYVETSQLDGESSLKIKQCAEGGQSTVSNGLPYCDGAITCDAPNSVLDHFNGVLRLEHGQGVVSIDSKNFVLRGSQIRNVDWCFGIVVYTGMNSKLNRTVTSSPTKRSYIEKLVNRYLTLVFSILVAISVASYTFRDAHEYEEGHNHDHDIETRDQLLTLLTFILLYNNLIPISLYVTLDIVRATQAVLIEKDNMMVAAAACGSDDDDDLPKYATRVQNSSLNDDLGQVDFIFTDKTGTITENNMIFRLCSIAGLIYGEKPLGFTESMDDIVTSIKKDPTVGVSHRESLAYLKHPKSFLSDAKLLRLIHMGPTADSPVCEIARAFMLCCAMCNTVIPEEDPTDTLGVRLQASNSDEEALAAVAASLGFVLIERTPSMVIIEERSRIVGDNTLTRRCYRMLGVHAYTSERKRMSIVVKEVDPVDQCTVVGGGRSLMLAKGADEVMSSIMKSSTGISYVVDGEIVCRRVISYLHQSLAHSRKFASAGLRTLMIGMRYLSPVETEIYEREYTAAKHSLHRRDSLLDKVALKYEQGLCCIGVTAVEDRIQRGAPETIKSLMEAGIRVWMLTGDKAETAINIGKSVNLIPEEGTVVNLSFMASIKEDDGVSLKRRDVEHAMIEKLKHAETKLGIINTSARRWSRSGPTALTLVVDGESLVQYLACENVRDDLLRIFIRAHAVIAYRLAPAQKANLVDLVRIFVRPTVMTLAIGDGANDVAMLQRAHLGIGVFGNEGMQAVRAADYAIGGFAVLQRLLLVHGRFNYNRISIVILYSFFKNICLIVPNFYFNLYNDFTGTSLYDSWVLMTYNVLWTFLPIVVVGSLDRDLPDWVANACPPLYEQGHFKLSFNAKIFTLWIIKGLIYATVSFHSTRYLLSGGGSVLPDGSVIGYYAFGTLEYFVVVVLVNLKLLIEANDWSSPFLVAVILSIILFIPATLFYSIFGFPDRAMLNVAQAMWFRAPVIWATSAIIVCFMLIVELSDLHFKRLWSPSPVSKLQEWLIVQRKWFFKQSEGKRISALLIKFKWAAPFMGRGRAARQSFDAVSKKAREFAVMAAEGIAIRNAESSEEEAASGSITDTAHLRRETLSVVSSVTRSGRLEPDDRQLRNFASKIHPLTLRFKDVLSERLFRVYALEGSLTPLRLAMVTFTVILLIWGVYESAFGSDRSLSNAVLRLGMPIVIIGFYSFTYTNVFRRHYVRILVGAALVVSIGKHVVEGFQERDSAASTSMLPVILFMVIRIPFVQATWISILQLGIFAIRYIALAGVISVSIDGDLVPRTCSFSIANLCQLLDYLPVMVGITVFTAFVGYGLEFYQRHQFMLSLGLRQEQVRNQDIMHNMLPPFVVEGIMNRAAQHTGFAFKSFALASRDQRQSNSGRHSSRGSLGSDINDDPTLHFAKDRGTVTVIFCDVDDFATLVASLKPKELVSILDWIFTRFDKIGESRIISKIETVAETYLACSGLSMDTNERPENRSVEDDALAALLFAIDVLEVTRRLDLHRHFGLSDESKANVSSRLVMKIGIHTGGAISGVVGSKKPQFALFGDTVNTASRMKSTGVADRVHLSVHTYEMLQDLAGPSFEHRITQVKGKGLMNTYLLVSYNPHKDYDMAEDRRPPVGCIFPGIFHYADSQVKAATTSSLPGSPEMISRRSSARSGDKAEQSSIYNPPNTSSLRSHVYHHKSIPDIVARLSDPSLHVDAALRDAYGDSDRLMNKDRYLAIRALGSKDANMITLKFHDLDDERAFRAQYLTDIGMQRRLRRALLIFTITYACITIQMLLVDQQPPLIVSRLLQIRVTLVLALALLGYAHFQASSRFNRRKLLVPTAISYVAGTLLTIFHPLLCYDYHYGCFEEDSFGHCTLWLVEGHFYHVNKYFSYQILLEILFWLTVINHNTGLLFVHLLGINTGIFLAVLLSTELTDKMVPELGSEYIIFSLAYVIINMVVCWEKERWARSIYATMFEHRHWQQQADVLLDEMLPSKVLFELKAGKVSASEYRDMTMLLSDICGYTQYAKSVPAAKVVALLTTLFTEFDRLSSEKDIYKVCTIGDAYLAVTDPSFEADKVSSSRRMVEFAYSMIEAMTVIAEVMEVPDLNMRIGLHLGNFIGGVIGTKKLRFDIWGVDVMIVTKVESNGLPGSVVASEPLKLYLESHFPEAYIFVPHKEIHVAVPGSNKAKKQLQLYRLKDTDLESLVENNVTETLARSKTLQEQRIQEPRPKVKSMTAAGRLGQQIADMFKSNM